MGRYIGIMNRTASLTLSLGSISADATRPRRGKLYDIEVGSEAAAADNPFLYVFQRFTAAGTSTAFAATKVDPADAATESDVGFNHTVEPTYTANDVVKRLALNQRASWRWQQDPAYGLTYPATASNGIGIQTPVAGLVLISATVYYEEQ